MAHRSCPIKIKYDGLCKWCPLPPTDRIKVCNFYRGQMRSGVPWVKDRHRWKDSEQVQW
jgi:hypothetical protein